MTTKLTPLAFITTTESFLNIRLCLQKRESRSCILTVVPNDIFSSQMHNLSRMSKKGPLAEIIERKETVLQFIYYKLDIRKPEKIGNFWTLLQKDPRKLDSLVHNVNEVALRNFFQKGIEIHSRKQPSA